MSTVSNALTIGRYRMYEEISHGGMATVHLGRLMGPAGFSRVVAIKRLHPQLARDADFVAMFLDEARLAARVRHPNVVSTLDVVEQSGELFLVMDYVEGESLQRLSDKVRERGEQIPLDIMVAIVAGALQGLHAAHEAADEQGKALNLVHRDFSPHNILVGVDGVARVIDFGVAKALGRIHTTHDGRVKGKLAYMAPEQLKGEPVTRQADLFAAGVVIWQAVTGQRLFHGESEALIVAKVLEEPIKPPSRVTGVPNPDLDAITMRALARIPSRRFANARDLALALEAASRPATASEVGAWVRSVASETLAARSQAVARVERDLTPTSSVSRSRSRMGLIIALVAAAIAAVGLGALLTRNSTPPAGVGTAPTPSSPEVVADDSTRAPPAASSAVPTVASAFASASAAPATPRADPGRSRPPKRTDCYYVDADGIRRIRASCR